MTCGPGQWPPFLKGWQDRRAFDNDNTELPTPPNLGAHHQLWWWRGFAEAGKHNPVREDGLPDHITAHDVFNPIYDARPEDEDELLSQEHRAHGGWWRRRNPHAIGKSQQELRAMKARGEIRG